MVVVVAVVVVVEVVVVMRGAPMHLPFPSIPKQKEEKNLNIYMSIPPFL